LSEHRDALADPRGGVERQGDRGLRVRERRRGLRVDPVGDRADRLDGNREAALVGGEREHRPAAPRGIDVVADRGHPADDRVAVPERVREVAVERG
jgi:hypothetical protein